MVLENSINRILLVTMCLLPFVFTPGIPDTYYLVKAGVIIILTLLILIKWILYEKEKALLLKEMAGISKIALVFLALLVVSMFFSENVLNSVIGQDNRWDGLIIQTCYVLLLVFSSFYFDVSDKNMHYLLLAGSAMAFIGLLQFLGILRDSFFHFPFNERFSRAFGTLGNTNYMGHYLVIILSVSVFYFFQQGKTRYLISSGFIYGILLTTNTRGSWLGGIIALGILVIHTIIKERNYKEVVILVVLFIVITIALDLLLDGVLILRFLTIIFELGDLFAPGPPDPAAGSKRMGMWIEGLKAIPEKPFFGVGISNYKLILERSVTFDQTVMANPHNDYINYAVTSGVPSALIYTSMIITGIYKSFKNLKTNQFAILFLAIVSAYAIQSSLTPMVISYSFIMWILLGAVARLNRGDKDHAHLGSIKIP